MVLACLFGLQLDYQEPSMREGFKRASSVLFVHYSGHSDMKNGLLVSPPSARG